MKKSDQKLIILYFFTDLIALNFSIFFMLFVKYGMNYVEKCDKEFVILCNVIWFLVVIFKNVYRTHWRYELWERFIIHFKSYILFFALTTILLIGFKKLPTSRLLLFGSLLLFGLIRLFVGYFLYRFISYLRTKGKNKRRVLILGAGRIGQKVEKMILKNPDLGFFVMGFLDDNHINDKDRIILGKLEDLENVLLSVDVDEIIIALPLSRDDKIQEAIRIADFFGIRVRLIPDYYRLVGRNFGTSNLGDIPLINIREMPLDDLINYSMKRVFDFFFSLLVLMTLSPVLIILSIVIKILDKGTVLYKPVRIGVNGKKFKLYKFRTMKENDHEEWGKNSTQKNDPRITKIGKCLRKYNIDELPQFINVLKGEMSVVGPRPHRQWLTEEMKNEVQNYMTRHYLRPGITGWAQVNGWRGLTDTKEKKVKRTEHDLWYLENWTFWLDVKIIFLTVFSRKTYKNAF